ncbi:hypothetical protein Pla52o_56120 [Novipirellula galeiformis]|uniref:Uncharacterized protein n=1 Tax=Novipirellula galeiformis TaxID=2528004 RepID=A0A5C6BL37_9BACT|nr:hypothetical protein Pla52o_56120 [Novipirellula galeiformis]
MEQPRLYHTAASGGYSRESTNGELTNSTCRSRSSRCLHLRRKKCFAPQLLLALHVDWPPGYSNQLASKYLHALSPMHPMQMHALSPTFTVPDLCTVPDLSSINDKTK